MRLAPLRVRSADDFAKVMHDAAYVGDSPEDVLMAKAAGVFAVAVPGAYPNRAALVSSEPDALAADLAGVVAALFWNH